ncbi:MAG: PH domain-containing protein [Chthoniobacterales bacterium]
MPEENVWSGTSSQWKNFSGYLLSGILAGIVVVIFVALRRVQSPPVQQFSPYVSLLLLVPAFMALRRYLQTKCKIYELTTERFKTTEGVFSKVTDTLELYRVKDLETHQPFLYRLVGLENIRVNTSDVSTPVEAIDAIPHAVALGDKIRNHVEAIRAQKGVREIDVE